MNASQLWKSGAGQYMRSGDGEKENSSQQGAICAWVTALMNNETVDCFPVFGKFSPKSVGEEIFFRLAAPKPKASIELMPDQSATAFVGTAASSTASK